MTLLPWDSRCRVVLTPSHIFVPQDFGAGEAGGSLQPGRLPLAVHTPQIRHSPREQQPDHHRDGPQRVHRGHQGAEEAADGRGRRGGGQVAHASLPWGQQLLKPSPLGGPSCCRPLLSVLCTDTGAEGSGNLPRNVNVSRMQCSPALLSLRVVMTSSKPFSGESCLRNAVPWVLCENVWLSVGFHLRFAQCCFQSCCSGEAAPQTAAPRAGKS